MSEISKYISHQAKSVRNGNMNAAGGFRNAGGNIPAQYTGRQMWQGASGAAMAPQAAPAAQQQGMVPTSSPYVLTISNASAGAIANFDIFGALTYLNTGIGTWSGGSWTYNNVTVSSALAGTSYQQLLGQSQNKPFGVGQTMLQISSGSNAQLTQPVNFSVTDASGENYAKPLIFTYNQYQNVQTQVTNYNNYIIDGNTKLTFSSIQASVVFQVFIYPYVLVDTTNSLVSANVLQQYANPGTNQQSVTLKG